MSGRLARTAQADDDLIAIWTAIARDNPDAADRVLDTLDARSRILADNPGLGPRRDDLAAGLRFFTVGSYLILYRVTDDGIEAVRYLHGRRNLPELLRDDGAG